MVVVSILLQAEFGRYDYREEAPHLTVYLLYVTLKSDEVVKNVDEKNRVLTAKLKMLNFPVPEFLNFPKFCDQTTEVVIVEQTSNYIKVKTNTKAKGFPFTESFEINQV